jgi:NADH-ubiquinone oxidoreductase chain 5
LPITYICFVVATLSLLGFPFTSGFFSKDWLLELFFIKNSSFSFYVYIIGLLTAIFTSFYSFRLLFISFIGSPLGSRTSYFSYHHEDPILSAVFCILFIPTVFFGYFYKAFYSHATSFLADFYTPSILILPIFYKLLPIFTILIGFLLAYFFVYCVNIKHLTFPFFYAVFTFFSLKWFIDLTYNYFISLRVLSFAKTYAFLGVEKGWIEFLGPTGVQKLFTSGSSLVLRAQTGTFFDYTFFFIFGFIGYFM